MNAHDAIDKLVEQGFGRKQSVNIYFSANPDKQYDPNAAYNFDALVEQVENVVQEGKQAKTEQPKIPDCVKNDNSDDESDYGTVVSTVRTLIKYRI